MAKSLRMDPYLQLNKIIARHPTEKLVLIRNTFVAPKNYSSHKLLKKEQRNGAWIIKEAHYISGIGKIMAEKRNKSLILTRCRLLYLLGLTFQIGVIIVAESLFAIQFQIFKLWKWLIVNQLKARKWLKRKPHDDEISKTNNKWTWWIEDLPNVSDDLFISICIVVGLGLLCGIIVLVRRFSSKNVRK